MPESWRSFGRVDQHYPGVPRVAVASNAEAVVLLAADAGLLAVAGDTRIGCWISSGFGYAH